MNSGVLLQKIAGPYGTVNDSAAAEIALNFPERVLRANNSILSLQLLRPHNKAVAVASKFSGVDESAVFGFRHVVWPYVKNALLPVGRRARQGPRRASPVSGPAH